MFKKLLLSYSILFLFLGNILFSNIHLLYHHDHAHNHSVEYHECEECIIIDNTNNCIQIYNQIYFVSTYISQISLQEVLAVDFNIKRIFLSRAPPIS